MLRVLSQRMQRSTNSSRASRRGPALKPAELLASRIDRAKGEVYTRRADELETAKGELDALKAKAVEAANAAKAEVHDEEVWLRLAAARLREQAARDQIDRLAAQLRA